jgi:hypothetical protein
VTYDSQLIHIHRKRSADGLSLDRHLPSISSETMSMGDGERFISNVRAPSDLMDVGPELSGTRRDPLGITVASEHAP